VSYGILSLCGISWSCSSSACDNSGGASRQPPLMSENLLACTAAPSTNLKMAAWPKYVTIEAAAAYIPKVLTHGENIIFLSIVNHIVKQCRA
jgi:hypothetical protein